MRGSNVKIVSCVLLAGALAACAGGPGHGGPRGPGGRGPGGGMEAAGEPRALKTSAGLLLASFDSDHDLQVTRDELSAGADRTFGRYDLNGDQDLSPLEFEAFAKAALDAGKSPPFRLDFDRDVDGRITAKEFRAELIAIFDSLDADKNGVLSHAELLKASEAEVRKRAPDGEGPGTGPPDGGGAPPGERGGRRPR